MSVVGCTLNMSTKHHYRKIGFLWWKRYRCMVDGETFKGREQAEFHCHKANKV